jgi:eukaryotic-like serine/threonine-protein kinase
MAPEQLQKPEVGRAADVYSLGAILFEVLAGEPLHARGAPIPSTLSSATVTSPAARRPERGIAPELDALCTAMLVKDPKLRPTARRCADSIEEFLDGDRDLERRRTMAMELVGQARAAYEAGLRADAMRAASRALALDPGAAGAAEIVTRLMLEPPREPPPEVREAARRTDAAGISRHARAAIPGYLLIACFLPFTIWNGVRNWPIMIAASVTALALALAAWRLVRIPDRSYVWMVIYACANALLLAVLSRLISSFIFVAALTTFITASVITYPAFLRRSWVLTLVMLGGFLIPIALEGSGAIPSTWVLGEGTLIIHGHALRVNGGATMATMLAANIAIVVMAGLQSVKLARANRDAQHQLVVQAWHLRQLLPAGPARPA